VWRDVIKATVLFLLFLCKVAHKARPSCCAWLLAWQEALEVALEADVAALQAMGFPPGKAREALQEVGGSVELAANWLLTHVV
jgi:uncharacterized UBP type Zn finger protein